MRQKLSVFSQFIISFWSIFLGKSFSIIIGCILAIGTSPAGLQNLDIRTLPNGLYSITIMDMGYALSTQKLIVRR